MYSSVLRLLSALDDGRRDNHVEDSGVKSYRIVVCKLLLLERALGQKAARPSARATMGYLVYKSDFVSKGGRPAC